MRLSDLGELAMGEGGVTVIHCHCDHSEERPFQAALVRKLALAGARWSEVQTMRHLEGDVIEWVTCEPTTDERINVYLNPVDVADLAARPLPTEATP